MTLIVAVIFNLASSALWLFGCWHIAKDINDIVVSGGVGGPDNMWEVILQVGIFGLLQSVGALRGVYAYWGSSMGTELNTRYFTLWKNSSGKVVAAEEDHAAPLWGCLFAFLIGGLVVVICSALISPIMFIANVSFAIVVMTSWRKGKTSTLGIILSAIIAVGCIGGTIYGWNYVSSRIEVLQERRRVMMEERQKRYEAQRLEQERIQADKRAEEERQRAEQMAAQSNRSANSSVRGSSRQEQRLDRQASSANSRSNASARGSATAPQVIGSSTKKTRSAGNDSVRGESPRQTQAINRNVNSGSRSSSSVRGSSRQEQRLDRQASSANSRSNASARGSATVPQVIGSSTKKTRSAGNDSVRGGSSRQSQAINQNVNSSSRSSSSVRGSSQQEQRLNRRGSSRDSSLRIK